jgi:hypothetical protein
MVDMHTSLEKVNSFLVRLAGERASENVCIHSEKLVDVFRDAASAVGLTIPNMHDITVGSHRIKANEFSTYTGDFDNTYDGWVEGGGQFLGDNNYVQVALQDPSCENSFGVLLHLCIEGCVHGEVRMLSFAWLEEDLSMSLEYDDGHGYRVTNGGRTLYQWLCKVGDKNDGRMNVIVRSCLQNNAN